MISKNKIKNCSIVNNLAIDDQNIDDLIKWSKKKSDFYNHNLAAYWYFPTKLSDLIRLARNNKLPPKTVNKYRQWEKDNNWIGQMGVDQYGFLIWKDKEKY